MINQACTEQLDDAIDYFEENWSPASPAGLRAVLEQFGLEEDGAALTELIRVDIELRYQRGLPIHLNDYFGEFDSLLSQPKHVAQIAFEDFRSRSLHGHPISDSRWRELPGIGNEI